MSKESNGEPRRLPRIALPTVLVVVLALGTFVVWYAVLTRAPVAAPVAKPNASASASASPKAVETPSPTPPPDPTAGWTRYTDSSDQFSLRYQSAWLQRTCTGDGHVSLYLAPAQAALGACNSDYGGQMSVIPYSGDHRSTYQLTTGYVDVVTQPVTVAGVTGQRQSATVGTSGELGSAVGTKIVQYVFYTRNRTYVCYYSQAPDGATSTNVLSDFDLMVNTLTFTANAVG